MARTREEALSALRKLTEQPSYRTDEFRKGTVSRIGDDGTLWVTLSGDAQASPCIPEIKAMRGDVVTVRITPTGRAYVTENESDPGVTGVVVEDLENRTVLQLDTLRADLVQANELIAEKADIDDLEAATARIGTLETTALTADSAVITNLQAEAAKVENLTASELETASAYIETLEAGEVSASDIVSDHAAIEELDVQSMAAATAYVGELTAGNVSAQNIISDHGNFATVQANAAKVQNLTAAQLEADHATVSNLSTTYADIHGANIDILTANSEWVDNLFVQTGLVANDGDVFTLDAIKVNAANITAGTIDVERIVVTDQQTGDKHMVTWNETTSTWDSVKLDGDVIEDYTIAADKIVANSITTSQITTQNLVGTGGWINLASGTFAYVNASTGDGISWDGSNLTINAASLMSTISGTYATQSALTAETNARKAVYGTSSTGQTTQTKSVTCANFTRETGSLMTVKFANTNTYNGTPKLNVNQTGAAEIRSYTGDALTKEEREWAAGAVLDFVFDGTYWRLADNGMTKRMSTAESSITQNATNISLKVSKDSVISEINQSAESVTINANRVNIEGAAIFTGSGRLSQTSLDASYDANGAASAAQAAAVATAAQDATTKVGAANYREQMIYRSAASGTSSMSSNTTWVTDSTGGQNKWTTVRPVYSSSYPVLFSATQRQTVAQSSGTTCSCTTPAKDDTTTVIDGGHITTGTIDASVATITNINASNITSGTLSANRIDTANITIGESQVTNLTTDLAGALKRTYVSIRVTAIDYSANSATLEATLYIDGTPTTTGVSYAWFKDGNEISSATADTYSVTSAGGGLSHAYSCKCSW